MSNAFTMMAVRGLPLFPFMFSKTVSQGKMHQVIDMLKELYCCFMDPGLDCVCMKNQGLFY